MEEDLQAHLSTVSNLVPTWELSEDLAGGSWRPDHGIVLEQSLRRSPYKFLDQDSESLVQKEMVSRVLANVDEEGLPKVDYELLHRREIARELLRSRLIHLAEMRGHRSAYEIAFILLAGAVAVLLVAPVLVQVLLAARGISV